MPASIERSYRDAVRAGLTRHDSALQQALVALVEYRYPPEIFALSFEVFSDGFTSGFPVRAFFMDRFNTEHFVFEDRKAQYPSPIDPGLIEIDQVYPHALEDDLMRDAPDLDPWDLATDELIEWFARHWQNAGGQRFPLAATISQHDAAEELNLMSNTWQPIYAAFDS